MKEIVVAMFGAIGIDSCSDIVKLIMASIISLLVFIFFSKKYKIEEKKVDAKIEKEKILNQIKADYERAHNQIKLEDEQVELWKKKKDYGFDDNSTSNNTTNNEDDSQNN
jgi:Mg2+/citrate symporter